MAAAATQTELTEDQVHLITRALADPRRYEILKHLGACCPATTPNCTAMRESVGISAATLSHHMRELETAGLVRPVRDGKFVHYTPRPEVLAAYLARLSSDLA